MGATTSTASGSQRTARAARRSDVHMIPVLVRGSSGANGAVRPGLSAVERQDRMGGAVAGGWSGERRLAAGRAGSAGRGTVSANEAMGAATVGAVAGWKLGLAWQEPKH